MRVSRDCWKCEYDDCGWIWLAAGDDAPEKCAKCRRRRWHTEGSVEKTKPLLPAVKDSGAGAKLLAGFKKKRGVKEVVPASTPGLDAYARPEHDKANCRNRFCMICRAVGGGS